MNSLEGYMFQHVSQLMAKYHQPVEDDSYWQALISDASWVTNQYKGTHLEYLANRLVMEVLDHLERVYKMTKEKI